jgi:ubiquinone/menaquinone biosynthesis C-methylase UbiE
VLNFLRMTPLGRAARRVRWAIAAQETGTPAGRLSVQRARSTMEAGVPVDWIIRIENHSRRAWSGFAVRHRWLSMNGAAIGAATTTPLPYALLPGDWIDLTVSVTGPAPLGDHLLVWEIIENGQPIPGESHADSIPVHVTFSRSNDIDYHAVFRTAKLDENAWWVVGAYHSQEQYRKSSLDRRSMLIDQGLTPDSRLLDVGCGTGQMAMALEDYLTDRGAYYGTDIGREAIEYCRTHFRRPNFVFETGGMTRLPFSTSAGPFEMAIFFSVFTHTFTDETALLLAETARLLGPNGVILADIITSEYVARGAGHRGEMWVNRAHFDQIAEVTGFQCKLLGQFPWGPHAQRHMLRLTRR